MRAQSRGPLAVLVALGMTLGSTPAHAEDWSPSILDVMNLVYCVVGLSPCEGLTPGGDTVDNDAVYEAGFDAGAASVDTDAIYNAAFEAGAASVDVATLYDAGYADGFASAEASCSCGPTSCFDDALCGESFAALDGDMNGFIDATEWSGSGETEELFVFLDTDGDGTVDTDEAATAFSAAYYQGASIGEYANAGMNTAFVAANNQGGYWWCVRTILLAETYTLGCLAAAPAAAAACAGVCAGTLGLGCVACVIAAGAGGIALCEAAFSKWTAASNAGCLGLAVAGPPDGGGTMFCAADTECGPGMVCSAGGCVYAPICEDDPICGETFFNLDTDGDNAIDSTEWDAYGEAASLFTYLDGNDDGVVDPEESAQIFSSAFYGGASEEDYAAAGLDTQLVNANVQGGYWWCVGTILLAETYTAGCLAAAPAAAAACASVCAGTLGLGCVACVVAAGAGGIALCDAAVTKWTAAQNGGCLGFASTGPPDGGSTGLCSTDSECPTGMVCSAGGCVNVDQGWPDDGTGCQTDGDCGTGAVCEWGLCVTDPGTGTGTGGVDSCTTDADCALGDVCTSGACVESTTSGPGPDDGDPCSVDSDCALGMVCVAGGCTSSSTPGVPEPGMP